MFIDQISYRLAEGVTEEKLQEAARDVLELWMKKQEGFLGWKINVLSGDEAAGYIDFVYWESEAAAGAASEKMGEIPPDHSWFACYDMNSVESKKLQNILTLEA